MESSEVKIVFRILGDGLSSELSSLLNGINGKLVEKGYAFPNSGKVNDVDYWEFETPYEACEDVEECLLDGLSWLLGSNVGKALAGSGYELFLDIVLRLDKDHIPSFSLENETVAQLGQLGVCIDVDISLD